MKILYFTSTGNSLYVARCIGGEQLSIPQLIKSGTYAIEDDAVGIVCPTYFGRVPKIVTMPVCRTVRRKLSVSRVMRTPMHVSVTNM